MKITYNIENFIAVQKRLGRPVNWNKIYSDSSITLILKIVPLIDGYVSGAIHKENFNKKMREVLPEYCREKVTFEEIE